MSEAVVELKAVPEKRLLSVRKAVSMADITARFEEVMGALAEFPHWPQMGSCVAYYYGESDEDMQVEIGFLAPEDYTEEFTLSNGEVMRINTTLPMPTAACMVYRGSYDGLGAAWEALMQWVSEHGYSISGPSCEVYLNDPDKVPPEEYLTELQLPVGKR